MKLTSVERREFAEYIRLFDFSEQLRDKSILLTGAGGMTGIGIIKWILLTNELYGTNIKIFASTRKPDIRPDFLEEGDAVEYCKFGCEEQTWGEVVFDYIIHCAAPTGREFFVSNPVETFEVIVDGTKNILELARKQEKCRVIYLSSMDIYGTINSELPVKENFISAIDNCIIRNAYPLGKKGAEFLCHAYRQEYGVDVVIIRPASMQGLLQPYQEPRIFNEILRCIIEEKNLVLKSDGTGKKCFLYTLDAISAIFCVLLKGISGEVYNVTNPETFIQLKDLARRIFEKFAPQCDVIIELQDIKETGYLPTFSFVQDNEKIYNLGWKMNRTIEEIYEVDVERFQ